MAGIERAALSASRCPPRIKSGAGFSRSVPQCDAVSDAAQATAVGGLTKAEVMAPAEAVGNHPRNEICRTRRCPAEGPRLQWALACRPGRAPHTKRRGQESHGCLPLRAAATVPLARC